MNPCDFLFRRPFFQNFFPLHKTKDFQYEVKVQSESILNEANEIFEAINLSSSTLLLYRQLDNHLPREKQRHIFLKLRIVSKIKRFYPEPVLKAFFNEDYTKIELSDIDIKESMVNLGYGSILLNGLIQIAKHRNVTFISGWISEVDRNHIDRLVHFYEKHEFEVILHEEKNSAKIGSLLWSNDLIQ
ncbi:GNAT family N-acetyltransferase [Planococcus sp. CPCC 101016]|uniref:GNAT family N-acetyltransferase n=1 Tax=Planococcus sp. CPCC 101016 TaxID=2599617 RepID=UPI001C93FF7D|nr:GNAT family N-acetyltransferase [Planococcus sp. CPCC 101016]